MKLKIRKFDNFEFCSNCLFLKSISSYNVFQIKTILEKSMVMNNNIDTLAKELEKQELEAANGIPVPQVYAQLLAIYLYQNDLCNAKYLWKRIPVNVKSSNAELGNIWAVGQHMWKRDFPAIYKALNAVTWSDSVAGIMEILHEKVRSRAIDLIEQAYSSITLDMVAAMTGLSKDIVGTACIERGWTVEMNTHIIHPVRSNLQSSGDTSSEDQLYKLTEFVSFLEN